MYMYCIYVYMMNYTSDRMEDVRPGTEDDDELEEKIQTVAMSDASSQLRDGQREREREREREKEREGRKAGEVDPEVSLITDFQLITDIRVSQI